MFFNRFLLALAVFDLILLAPVLARHDQDLVFAARSTSVERTHRVRRCPRVRKRESARYRRDRLECEAYRALSSVEEFFATSVGGRPYEPETLYGLMSNEFREMFSLNDLSAAISSGPRLSSFRIVGAVEVFGEDHEWGQVTAITELESGEQVEYVIVLKREANDWKIFGTQKVTPQ